MPPESWLAVAAALAAIHWTVPKLLNQIKRGFLWNIHALGDHIHTRLLADIENQLAPSWLADFEDRLEPILCELSANGGTSVKDKVNSIADTVQQIQRDIEPVLIEFRNRPNRS